jgi:hypothetical protein
LPNETPRALCPEASANSIFGLWLCIAPQVHFQAIIQAIIKTTQIKIKGKIKNQNNKLQSQQSNQQMLPTRRKSPNTTKIKNKKK